MQRFYVITFRREGVGVKKFLRGADDRYAIYLPRLSSVGWVDSITQARLFVRPPDFGPKSIHASLDAQWIHIYHYRIEVGHDNVIRPTHRPKKRGS